MALQTLTLEIPDSIYRRLVKLAEQSKTPLAAETVNLLASALSDDVSLTPELEEFLEQLSYLTDVELFQASKMVALSQDEELMQGLLDKRQREGLDADELAQVEKLSQEFNRIMLIRAQSASLLIERGFDRSKLFAE